MSIEQYIAYLMSEPGSSSCIRASEVLEVSHDKITRLLNQSHYTSYDLFTRVKDELVLAGGTLTVDDSVLDKPYTDHKKSELVGYYWSGKHHKAVKGINLISLVYTDINGLSLPVNYRLYTPEENKSKNEYFEEMFYEVLSWGLAPARVTADSWYSSIGNLKFLRKEGIAFLVGLKSNRVISTEVGVYQSVIEADIPQDGLYTHLKKFGFIKVFRTVDQDENARHYAMWEPEKGETLFLKRTQFKQVKKEHWNVEKLFRLIKQTCQAERFWVRTKKAVHTHLFSVLRAAQRLLLMAKHQIIDSAYAIQRTLFIQAQKDFITQYGQLTFS